jgi:hypothetical protein
MRELVLFEPAGGRRREREVGADVGLGRAFAHHAGVAAPAQRQLQRIDQDRLAGAGLAGEDREAGELEFDRVDDDEVADGQCAQHEETGLPEMGFLVII